MEKTDVKNNIKKNYLLLYSIHNEIDYLSKKDKNNIKLPDNLQNQNLTNHANDIIIKYLQDNNIIFTDKTNLINLIIQLQNFIKDNKYF